MDYGVDGRAFRHPQPWDRGDDYFYAPPSALSHSNADRYAPDGDWGPSNSAAPTSLPWDQHQYRGGGGGYDADYRPYQPARGPVMMSDEMAERYGYAMVDAAYGSHDFAGAGFSPSQNGRDAYAFQSPSTALRPRETDDHRRRFDDASRASRPSSSSATNAQPPGASTAKRGGGAAVVKPPPSPPRQLAPVSATSNSCTRITVCSLGLMCLAWPALLIAGIVLALAANPQDGQTSDFNSELASYQTSTQSIVLSTTGTTPGSSGTRALSPQYRQLTNTPFPSAKSVVLATTEIYPVPETLGSNLGSISVVITYKQSSTSAYGQTFTFTSPPVSIRRSAQKQVYCTAAYATICGTTTCCTQDQMTQQCLAIVRSFSQTAAVTFVGTIDNSQCKLGVECGYCQYDQFVTELCFVIQWSAVTGWSADSTKSSCSYPFLQTNQVYGDSDKGATVTLRSSDDPYIFLQQMTQGTLQLSDDGSNTRNTGRALILFGCLVLLLGLCVVGLTKFCGADVLTIDALERGFGCKLRRDRDKYANTTMVKFGGRSGAGPADGGAGTPQPGGGRLSVPPMPFQGQDRWREDSPPRQHGYGSSPPPPPAAAPYRYAGGGYDLDDPLL